ncbi:hypothetical protein MASR2M29_12690 [Spirochaetota bacterium]
MGSFTVMDRLFLAIAVIRRWEVLLTLAAFIALWLLLAKVANPWRRENSFSHNKARRKLKKPKSPKAALPEPVIDEDSELPD